MSREERCEQLFSITQLCQVEIISTRNFKVEDLTRSTRSSEFPEASPSMWHVECHCSGLLGVVCPVEEVDKQQETARNDGNSNEFLTY